MLSTPQAIEGWLPARDDETIPIQQMLVTDFNEIGLEYETFAILPDWLDVQWVVEVVGVCSLLCVTLPVDSSNRLLFHY